MPTAVVVTGGELAVDRQHRLDFLAAFVAPVDGAEPGADRHLASTSGPPGLSATFDLDTSGADILRENVRITRLPGSGDTDALDVLTQLPEMCLFSSDYPHMEGDPDPINLYGPALDELDPGVRRAFLGGNTAEAFARLGVHWHPPDPGRRAR